MMLLSPSVPILPSGRHVTSSRRLYQPLLPRNHFSLSVRQRHVVLSTDPFLSKRRTHLSLSSPGKGFQNVEAISSAHPFPSDISLSESDDQETVSRSDDIGDSFPLAHKTFKNRFLNFVRFGAVINDAAESFFKSEIRRRLFVTAALLIISRVGYFIPLPGFDRRLIPRNYLSFVSGASDQLGDLSPELKMSLFQLGISPQIAASILMQILCHILPSLVKLRKEGLDGHEKIKGYIWWISLGFAMLEGLIVACYSLQYSIYAASHM